jgi:hypothetical protein
MIFTFSETNVNEPTSDCVLNSPALHVHEETSRQPDSFLPQTNIVHELHRTELSQSPISVRSPDEPLERIGQEQNGLNPQVGGSTDSWASTLKSTLPTKFTPAHDAATPSSISSHWAPHIVWIDPLDSGERARAKRASARQRARLHARLTAAQQRLHAQGSPEHYAMPSPVIIDSDDELRDPETAHLAANLGLARSSEPLWWPAAVIPEEDLPGDVDITPYRSLRDHEIYVRYFEDNTLYVNALFCFPTCALFQLEGWRLGFVCL